MFLNFWRGLTLTFDFKRSPEIKNIFTNRKPIQDFLSNFYWHFLSHTVFEIFDFKVFRVWPWPLKITCMRSKIFSPFESPCMTSYLISVDTFSLSHTVFEIFDFKVFRVWSWPLEVTWGQNYSQHSKAHTWLPINFYWHFLSISYRFWDIRLQSLQRLT